MVTKVLSVVAAMLFCLSSASCGNDVEDRDVSVDNGDDAVVPAAAPTVKLNSGYEMPVLGLGTWTLGDRGSEEATYEAIRCGYRLFDTAKYYSTEAGVGRAIRRAISEGIITREDVFVTSKVTPWGYSDYDTAIEESNEAIGLGYIDLMLIHQSGSDEKNLYRAIERAIDKGIVRSLGISNYYTQEAFDNVTEGAAVMPAIVQNENHIFYQNTEFQQYVDKFGCFVESYYPFGGRGNTSTNLGNATIQEIAAAHGRTAAQITLRWQVQAGYIAIPGSSNPSHIRENISIFDFSLSDEEMDAIAALNKNQRYNDW